MKEIRNVFSICLGIVFRRAREQRGWSYKDLALKTDIKPSYILAFEKANAIFHISKAYSLYKAFFTDEGDTYSLEGIVSMLYLTSHTDSKCNDAVNTHQEKTKKILSQEEKNKIYCEALFQTCQDLAKANSSYAMLFKPFFEQNFFHMNVLDGLVKEIEKQNIDKVVELFIRQPDSFKVSKPSRFTSYFSEYFYNVPSMFGEHLNNVKNSILMLPTTLVDDDYEKWININTHKVSEAIIILLEGSGTKVASQIRGEFLLNTTFDKLTIYTSNMLTIANLHYHEVMKDDIIESFFEGYPSNIDKIDQHETIEDFMKSKIEIKALEFKDEKQHVEFVNRFKSVTAPKMKQADMLLLYFVPGSFPVGFLASGWAGPVINLPIHEVIDWLNFIDRN